MLRPKQKYILKMFTLSGKNMLKNKKEKHIR